MRTIITGDHTATYEDVAKAVALCGWTPTVVLCSGVRGLHFAVRLWASDRSIPVEKYSMNRVRYGRRAAYLRNHRMLSAAQALIVVWDGRNQRTAHMLDTAAHRKLRISEYRWRHCQDGDK